MRRAFGLPIYRRLLIAYALNELAWSIGTLALAVLVYRRTGSALGSTGFFLCAQVVPAFIAPALVARLDRHPQRRLLPSLYALEAFMFALLALMTSHFALVPVLVLTLLDGVIALVARAFARTASVAVLSPAGLLPEGNALTNAVFSVCFMAGPAIGGVVVVAGGTVAALLVNCGVFAGIALILVTAGLTGAASDETTSRGRLRAALAHVRSSDGLRILMSLQAVGMVFFTISIPVEVVFAQRTLGSGAGGYGALLAAWGAGAIAGSAVYARWRRRSARLLIAGSGGTLGCGLALMAVAPTIGVAVIGAALGGASNGVEMVATRTALQERTEPGWMARIMGLNESLAQATPGLGILLGGAIAALSGPRIALGVAAAGSFAFTVAAWLALGRPAFHEPPPRGPEPARPERRGASDGTGAPEPAGAPERARYTSASGHETLVP
jgi:predicted MFS family arabinose efflux permease